MKQNLLKIQRVVAHLCVLAYLYGTCIYFFDVLMKDVCHFPASTIACFCQLAFPARFGLIVAIGKHVPIGGITDQWLPEYMSDDLG